MFFDLQVKQTSQAEPAQQVTDANKYSTAGTYVRSRDLPKFISSKKEISRFLNWQTEAHKNYERAIYNTCCNLRDLEKICRGLRGGVNSWAYDHIKHQYARRALEGERQILAHLLDLRFERVVS